MKNFVSIALMLVLLLSLSATAFAADDPPLTYSSVPTSGTPADGSTGGAEGVLPLGMMSAMSLDGIAIFVWRNSITEVSSGYLKLYGLTNTDLLADRIELNFTLQQWNGTSWVTYSTSNNYDTYSDYLPLTIYRYVAHGYYYRVKTVHNGYLDGTYDSQTLYSSYIWVA